MGSIAVLLVCTPQAISEPSSNQRRGLSPIMTHRQADVAVLVISSRKGEYETGFEKGGQVRTGHDTWAQEGAWRLV